MSTDVNSYIVSEPSDIDSLKSALDSAFAGMKETTERTSFEIYDTFDWRLYKSDRELIRKGAHFDLIHASRGKLISDIGTKGKKEIMFCRDFPSSDFTDYLEKIVEMRALMPVARVEKKVERLAICNTDDKTVARVEFESLAIMGKDHRIIRCRLFPMRGYSEESGEIRAIAKKQHLPRATGSGMADLLRKSGIEPGAYSSKIDVTLQPKMPALKAVKLILENLVAVMHQNLDGVRKDIDTEFLHDLRVAIRRARSLLGQTKGVFDEDTTSLLQSCLRTMGGVSGHVRDLDVYLLKKEAYVKKVPEALRPGILQLFHSLRRKRRAAWDRMLKSMAGKDFKDALGTLEKFFKDEPAVQAGADGTAPVYELARAVIYKRFRRVIRKGRQIYAETPDEKLHELRIDCKKLRYLLEFFTSLFPAEQMKRLIKQLKGLQENLGDFNDLSVQQEFLVAYLEAIHARNQRSVLPAAAVGGLIARLFADQHRVRSEFLGVFKSFSSEENKAAFRNLFT